MGRLVVWSSGESSRKRKTTKEPEDRSSFRGVGALDGTPFVWELLREPEQQEEEKQQERLQQRELVLWERWAQRQALAWFRLPSLLCRRASFPGPSTG